MPDKISLATGTPITLAIPKYAGAAQANQAYRWLLGNPRASTQQSSLFYDGLVLRIQPESEHDRAEGNPEHNIVDFIPAFSLEDYMEHEFITGISLSIEITSILLEFDDATLRDKALEEFEQRVLETIVSSPLFFTRNTVARHFFQQILLERNVQHYLWTPSQMSSKISDAELNNIFNRASKHADILKTNMPHIPVPDKDICKAMDHLIDLLSIVNYPINLPKYVDKPTHGLAVFCHPSHKNVQYFLNELKTKDTNRITIIPRRRTNEHELFRLVHTKVKAAIKKINK